MRLAPVMTVIMRLFVSAGMALLVTHANGAAYYETLTGQSLTQLEHAVDRLEAGDIAGSEAALKRIDKSVEKISSEVVNFRKLANWEHHRCVERAGDLTVMIGELLSQQDELLRQIDQTEAQLSAAAEDSRISREEITTLRRQLDYVTVAMRERQRRMQELVDWWWVPGYGQYLAARTWIDDDLGAHRRLANTLRDQIRALSHKRQALAATQTLAHRLANRRKQLQQTGTELRGMQRNVEERLAEVNRMAVFLADAEIFWDKLRVALKYSIADSQTDLMLLTDLLRKETHPILVEEFTSGKMLLRDALIEFSASLDSGNHFLRKGTTEYCGGPPLSRQARSAATPAKCNFAIVQGYYEILDPRTCTFRYLNPPGCPPQEIAVPAAPAALRQHRLASKWPVARDQNWVGRHRCASAHAIYYGRKASWSECEQACKEDLNCRFWTFNEHNSYMPDSRHECWGAKTGLTPHKVEWKGFHSGGH